MKISLYLGAIILDVASPPGRVVAIAAVQRGHQQRDPTEVEHADAHRALQGRPVEVQVLDASQQPVDPLREPFKNTIKNLFDSFMEAFGSSFTAV